MVKMLLWTFALMVAGSTTGVLRSSNAEDQEPLVVLLNNDAADQGGAEQGEKCLETAFGGDVQHNNGQASAEQTLAEYSFEPTKDGCYAIEEYHPAVGCGGLTPGMAPVRIDYCKGEVAMGIVDQRQNGGQWNYITKLPFYVGHTGKISVTRKDFPAEVCPTNDCLYMADAFRLTWISEKCNYANAGRSVREELEKEEEERTRLAMAAETEKREQMRKRMQDAKAAQEQRAAATSAAEKEKAMEQPIVAVRMVVEEFKEVPKDDTAKPGHLMFPFKAPLDGCYVLEEKHPHRPEEKKPVPYQVNYCKGRSASAAVHHADGRHGQWNYVAHFPYYDDEENAGVLVPRRLLQEKNAHAFRYTYVGPRCSTDEAEVHKMELRTTVDFSALKDRIPEFKERLRQILAGPAGVAMERILVSHVRAGSVISELTLLPAAVHAPGIDPSSKHSASDAVLAIEKALESDLGKEICALADPAATSTTMCTTQVTAKGRAPTSLVEQTDPSPSEEQQQIIAEEESSMCTALYAGLGVSAAAVGALFFYLGYRRMKQKTTETTTEMPETQKKETPEEEMDPVSPTVVVAPVKGKPAEGIPDDTSTITPKDDDLEKASNISSEVV